MKNLRKKSLKTKKKIFFWHASPKGQTQLGVNEVYDCPSVRPTFAAAKKCSFVVLL